MILSLPSLSLHFPPPTVITSTTVHFPKAASTKMGGCSAASGGLDDSKFAEPLPAVGLYVAGASLLCALAIGLDVLRGIRLRRPWFPCRYVSLNSATLTILGIATKFPVDLNTAMPSRTDQLSKLSSTVLICTMMAIITPSLGTMDKPELVPNVVALGILVVTVVVNVCIQMGTGVIYAFLPEHAVVLYFILLLLVVHVIMAMGVPGMRDQDSGLVEYWMTRDRLSTNTDRYTYTTEELRDRVKKRLVAEDGASNGAQLAIATTGPFRSTSAFGLLGLLILMEAFVRSSSLVSESSSMFCKGTSEYKWSVAMVLIAQAVVIVLGALPSASRCFNYWRYRRSSSRGDYVLWAIGFSGMYKEVKGGRMKRKLFAKLMVPLTCSLRIVLFFTWLANGIISMAVFLPSRQLAILWSSLLKERSQSDDIIEQHNSIKDQVISIAEEDIERWISKGKKRRPTELMELIKEGHSHCKGGFGGVLALNYLHEDTPNCWAIHIVALAVIAAALPDIDSASIESLLEGVHQGLRYVRLVDKYLEGDDYTRRAADKAWFELDNFNMWDDKDIRHLLPKGSSRQSAVQKLRDMTRLTPIEDPICYIVSRGVKPILEVRYCVNRVAEVILEDYDRQPPSEGSAPLYPFLPRTDDNLFPWLRMTISDVLRACLTSLPCAIYLESLPSSTEKKKGLEKRANNATYMIGEVWEEIVPLLLNHRFAHLYPDRREHIVEWPQKVAHFPTPTPSSTVDELSSLLVDQIVIQHNP